MIPRRHHHILWLGLAAVALQSVCADFQLEKIDNRYTLVAHQAIIQDILDEIDDYETVPLKFYGNYQRPYSGTLTNETLDGLLYRLGVSYLLMYEQDDQGDYHLSDATMLGTGSPASVAGKNASGIDFAKLINDLRDDDIPWNGHRAYRALEELGCDAVPWLEPVLHDSDLQARYAAAQLLRTTCEDYEPSQRLLEVTMELLRRGYEDDPPLAEFIWPWDAYGYLEQSNVYPRVRSRLLTNLQSANLRERLYSALIVAKKGEHAFAGHLVRILAPHLADNDLRQDAGLATRAIFMLGQAALPHLQPYRFSKDQQQAELAELIATALETGEIPVFHPVMYAGYVKMPLTGDFYSVNVAAWKYKNFPDDQGNYHQLREPRMTMQDYYGPWDPSNWERDDSVDYDHSATIPDAVDHEPFVYRVKEGESLKSIAAKFASEVEQIIAINPGLSTTKPLTAGDQLLIPWE